LSKNVHLVRKFAYKKHRQEGNLQPQIQKNWLDLALRSNVVSECILKYNLFMQTDVLYE